VELLIVVFGPGLEQGGHLLGGGPEIEALSIQILRARFELRELQDRIDGPL